MTTSAIELFPCSDDQGEMLSSGEGEPHNEEEVASRSGRVIIWRPGITRDPEGDRAKGVVQERNV
jgi:hypothetical protein